MAAAAGAASHIGLDLCGRTAGAELGSTGSPQQHRFLPASWPTRLPLVLGGACAQQPEWECLARTSGHSLSPLPSFPWPLHPGSPILTPGSMSGTHLPAPNHWAASWTSFIPNTSLSQPCLAEASPALPPDTDKHPPPPLRPHRACPTLSRLGLSRWRCQGLEATPLSLVHSADPRIHFLGRPAPGGGF